MKKFIFLFVIVITMMVSCTYTLDHKKFIVTDFSKIRVDTLVPSQNKSYYSAYVKIKGSVNDTISIEGYRDIKLSGKIDTLLNTDYYGTQNIIFIFNPYKATTGKLEIEYHL